jgi:hypothetical protein
MKNGMTADEFIDAVKADAEHLARVDLSYDVVAGFIELLPAGVALTKGVPPRPNQARRGKTLARK